MEDDSFLDRVHDLQTLREPAVRRKRSEGRTLPKTSPEKASEPTKTILDSNDGSAGRERTPCPRTNSKTLHRPKIQKARSKSFSFRDRKGLRKLGRC